MSVVQEQCPACGGPIPILPGSDRLSCSYCSATLRIERRGNVVMLELAERVLDTIEQSGAQTQAELQRMNLRQELSLAQMKLTNVKSEMRSIQRSSMNGVSRNHLKELHDQSLELEREIARLEAELDPASAAASVAEKSVKGISYTPQRLIWLLTTLQGRATRMDFWIGAGIAFLVGIALLTLGTMARAMTGASVEDVGSGAPIVSGVATFLNLIVGILWIVLIWLIVTVGTKRFQDRDKPGWWLFAALIPLIGPLWLLVELGVLEGTPGPNRYG